MNSKKASCNRRTFVKAAASAGFGSMLAATGMAMDMAGDNRGASPAHPLTMPTRPFGNSGCQLPILALGGYFDTQHNQPLLDQAVRLGITYWETSFSFGGAKEGFGSYLKRHPACREKLFLSAKTSGRDPGRMSQDLDKTLQALNTAYIDFFVVHGVDDATCLNASMRKWVDKAKTTGRIKLFGFSTHSNMEACMSRASRLGWIDGIMSAYNYRLMHGDEMRRAVDSCAEAGIGLNAIKTQAELTNPKATIGTESETALRLTQGFIRKGFTFQQAKLKAVWENPNIASICSLMPNMTILLANVAAALDRTKLSTQDLKLLDCYASETAAGYCRGCANICEPAMSSPVPISKVMRCLMYFHSYGDRDRAKRLYSGIPGEIRTAIASLNYAKAESRCPQKMAIGVLMTEASGILGGT